MSCWAVMMTLWSAFLSAAVELKGLFNDSMANIAILFFSTLPILPLHN